MIRVGQGFDVHQLVEGRPCIIGGVNIPYEKGLLEIAIPMQTYCCMPLAMLSWARLAWETSGSIFQIMTQNLRMLTVLSYWSMCGG